MMPEAPAAGGEAGSSRPADFPAAATAEQLAQGLQLATRLIAEGQKTAALAWLGEVAESEEAPEEVLCLLIEHAPDMELRKRMAGRLLQRPQITGRARRLLSTHIRENWPLAEQAEPLMNLHRGDPKEFGPYLNAVRYCATARQLSALQDLLSAATTFGPARASLVQFLAALDGGDAERAFSLFMARAREHNDVPKQPGLRLSQMLRSGGFTAKQAELLALLSRHHPDVAGGAASSDAPSRQQPRNEADQMRDFVREMNWDEAEALYRKLLQAPEPRLEPARLAAILYLAHTGRATEALAEIDREKLDGVYPQRFHGTALRILAELGKWEDLYTACAALLPNPPPAPGYFAGFVKAARELSRLEELLAGLETIPEPRSNACRNAIEAIIEDLAERGEDVTEALARHSVSAGRLARIRGKRPARPAALASSRDICLCYCTDAAYATPALVSLVSLALTNPDLARRARLVVMVDQSAAHRIADFDSVAKRLGLSLEVRRAEDVVPDGGQLQGRYGFFTGGQALSSAAYYRIFLARALAAGMNHAEALYIDADTLVHEGLDQLFGQPMTMPLMARPDVEQDGISALARSYGLKGPYFNSGVLRFHLGHRDLLPALDASIRVASERTLAFHDQCALNIGFDGLSDAMPGRFNWFASSHHRQAGEQEEEGVIVHYLDRPKPWDSLYRGDASAWFMYHKLARNLAGEAWAG